MSASRDGSDQVWGLISTLVAGPAVWGAAGYGVDRLADTSVFTPVGVVVGFVTGFYIVYVKATKDGRSAPASREGARPDPGSEQGDSR